jgi:hypothetical protein
MPLTDKVLAVLSMALVIAFLGILVWWVRELDLTIVIVLVCVLAIIDFWKGAGHDQTISMHKD